MPKDVVSLKSVIDMLERTEQIPVGYISFRQTYLRGKLPEELTKYIMQIRKYSSISYYINKPDIERFSEALIKQFN